MRREPSAQRQPSGATELQGFQRRYLRKLAHPLRPVVLVGEGGVSPGVVSAIDDALHSHELIKVRLKQPGDKRGLARELAAASGAALCGVVGHTVILYRPDAEKPGIELPARE